jgi:hypothetical protein
MSAAVALTPRVRMMAICDDVRESILEADVFDLDGVRQSIDAPAFPFVPLQLWLFLVLSSPRAGSFPGYIRIVNDRTEKAVFFGHLDPYPAFDADAGTAPACAPIRCAFPEDGTYSVQVWFFREEGSDVLKGEMPFFIDSGGIGP